MNCPGCGQKNQENDKVCSKCGLNLKIACPRCKALNLIGQEKCFSCNLKLISFCPKCKTPNHPTAKNCKKCGEQLLKECPECKALNSISRTECFKCKKGFKPVIQQAPSVKSVSLQDYAVLSVELINFSAIKAKIQQDDTFLKLQNRFFQIIALEAKNNSETAKKLSDKVMAIEFKNAKSTKISAACAVIAAKNILNSINELNYHIKNKFKIMLKAKIGISIINIQNKNYFAQIERSIATTNDIIVSAKLYNLTSDKFNFEIIGPLPVNNNMMTFYKLKEVIEPKLQVKKQIQEIPKIKEQIKDKTEDKLEDSSVILKKEEEIKKSLSQNEICNFLVNTLTQTEEGFIIGVSAPDGAGKSLTVSLARQALSNSNKEIIWLIGQCNPVAKIAPFAFFQDLFRIFFRLPLSNTNNIEESKKRLSGVLETIGIKDKQTEIILYKLLFYEFNINDNFDLFANKQKVYECIQSLFDAVTARFSVVLAIEDLEFIDDASLEFIKYLLNKNLLNKKIWLIINHSPDLDLKNYFRYVEDKKLIQLYLRPMTDEEMNKVLLSMLNNQDMIPQRLKNKIFKNAKGLPVYIEQVLWLLFSLKAVYTENNVLKFNPEAVNPDLLPDSIENILQVLFAQINRISADAIKIILNASILGQKFMPVVVKTMTNIEEKQFVELIQTLLNYGIFINLDNYNLSFKHKLIWEIIYKQNSLTDQGKELHNMALQVLENYTRTNGAILAIHAERANLPRKAISHWSQAVEESIAVGDVQSYTIYQQKILNLLDQIDLEDKLEDTKKEDFKINIYEQIGRANYEFHPQEAVKYLSKAIIEREKRGETAKLIELAGYLSKSCELTGNYTGIIECADKAISVINKDTMPIEFALLNYSKLEAIYNLGRLEEVIVIAKNDIIPILREFISKNIIIPDLSIEEFNYIEAETQLILAKALATQGDKETVDITNALALKAGEFNFIDIEVQAKLTDALFKTLQGEIKASRAILEYLKEIIPKTKNQNFVKFYWGFINVLSNIFEGNFNEAGNIIYSVSALADECKEYNIQVIIRLLIGKLAKETGNFEQAKFIYNEFIRYCSEYKLATGALLGWYLIVEMEMVETNIEKAQNIAEKALEVSKKPGINNYFFTILLQRLIAETQIIKGDFEAAQMYVEQALSLAEKLDLYLLQSKLYLTFGKIYHENAVVSDKNRENNVNNAYKFYTKALDIAKKIESEYITLQIGKELSNLGTFCQLSGIKY
ncbi:MAG: zinc ribbon domain-containing protein [bacterium]